MPEMTGSLGQFRIRRLRRCAVKWAYGVALGSVLSMLAGASPGSAETLRRLPDGEVARAGALTAYLIDPTTRYAHGVLGDAIEAGGFAVERGGRRLVYRLGQDAVFEDRRVRLVDIDGDGAAEALVVKSYLNRGAALAVYKLRGDAIAPLAESAAIGTPNRWLNPAGVADFSGSGERLVAAVITPHLAGSLRLYRLAGGALAEVARLDGVTNHILGSRDLDLARIADIDRDGVPEIVLPTLDRTALVAVGLRDGKLAIVRRKSTPRRIASLRRVRDGKATVTLEGGKAATVDLTAR